MKILLLALTVLLAHYAQAQKDTTLPCDKINLDSCYADSNWSTLVPDPSIKLSDARSTLKRFAPVGFSFTFYDGTTMFTIDVPHEQVPKLAAAFYAFLKVMEIDCTLNIEKKQ